MDDDSNQSSRTSQRAEQDESQHRESESQMTLEYESDSELDVTDTLRMEVSDEEGPVALQAATEDEKSAATIVNESSFSNDPERQVVSPFEFEQPDESTEKARKPSRAIVDSESDEETVPLTKVGETNVLMRKKISQLIDSDSEDEQPGSYVNRLAKSSQRNVSKIVDSASDDSPVKSSRVDDINSGNDSDCNRVEKQNLEIDAIGEKIEKSMNRFKSLIDSDSATPEEELDGDLKRKKKLKTKKEREKTKNKKDPKDLLASLNLDFSDEGSRSGVGTSSSSGEENRSGSDREEHASKQKRKKSSKIITDDKPQRMSAKAAMEQMKVIQSESQRMAREANVSIPYHRPKQHTLQEFLNRRTVFKPVVSPAGGGHKKLAATIKMTSEQLAAYAKQLEEREKEAMEFFKSESDEEAKKKECEAVEELMISESNIQLAEDPVATDACSMIVQNDNTITIPHELPSESVVMDEISTVVADAAKDSSVDTELCDTLKVCDTEEDPLDALVNKTYQNAEQLLASQAEPVILTSFEPTPGTSKPNPLIDYDIFSEPTPSKLAQKKAELLSNTSIPAFPTLKGDPNMDIDLDSGDLKPKAPSGVAILFERFAKFSGKKAKKASNLSILNTDRGMVEMETISISLEHEERDPNGKEPIPGAAYVKLKQSLREKMDQTRRDALRKRQEETQETKKWDDDEDDEEEILQHDQELEDEEEGKEEDGEVATEGTGLLDDEADEVENDGDEENDVGDGDEKDDDDDESSDESSDEDANEPMVEGEKKKSRILAAFEDSDEEIQNGNDAAVITSVTLKKAETEELFSTLEDTDKFTQSDRNNLESEGMTLLWKETEDPATATQVDDDLLALCSGRFETTQAPPLTEGTEDAESLCTTQPMTATQSELALTARSDKGTTEALFTQRSEHQPDDSELMALCSGTFATQRIPEEEIPERETNLTSEVVAKSNKLVIESSDEEERNNDAERQKKKKKRRRNINISDDDESASDAETPNEELEDEDAEVQPEEEEEYEEAEHLVDYDSEENEVEVVMTKKDRQKVANDFLEKEAALSESEWGSADEDEKDLDRYDIELGDEEKFDQKKLQEELERIHTRRMLEQDKKEVKTLQDMFFEDEEKDGVGRERQFRWRNAETTFNLEYDKKPDEENGEEGGGSDDEAEWRWRKMRHERELLLKEKKIDLDEVNLTDTLLDKTLDEEENNSSVNNTTTSLVTKKKITVIRSKKSSEANTPSDSPFLITKSTIVQGHKASFLSRDADTLNKLASLVKVNPETEGANTVVAGKGRNFVFATVSPAVDKMASKRSLDAEVDGSAQSAKKAKILSSMKDSVKTKKRLLLGQLM